MTRLGRRAVIVAACSAILELACLSGSASAQARYPERPVRIVVPAAAGGALDLISRILAQKVSEIWGQQVFVENRPGANWLIGMDVVAKSPPDGYTLLFLANSGITINPYVFPSMKIDPLKEFVPVTAATDTPFVLLTNPKLPKDIHGFLSYLRQNPGKLNHGSNSATTMLISELFKSQAKLDYVDVNYKGASQAMNDTITGAVQFCFVDLGSGSSAMDAGLLNALALTSPTRYKLKPSVPTLAESGLPGFSVSAKTLVMAPAAIDPAILSRLNEVFLKALASPDVVGRLQAMGQVVLGGTPEQIRKDLVEESDQWRTLVKERNIRFEQ